MERLEPESLREGPFDQAVLASTCLDQFCSSSAWGLGAHQAFTPRRQPFVWRSDDNYLAFMTYREGGWNTLTPLEFMWLLGCPMVGPDPRTQIEMLLSQRPPDVEMVMVSGVYPGSPLLEALLQGARRGRFQLHPGPETRRCVASLEGGVDGFLSRRSRQFRSRLRRSRKRFFKEGFEYQIEEDRDRDPALLYRRIQALEVRSWKSGRGIDSGGMREFYDDMIAHLLPQGRLRLAFLRRDGVDVAYILGGVFGKTYRGLQFSYDESLSKYSLGNVAQLLEIERLVEQGVEEYDLGTRMPYKLRWAELERVSVTLQLL